MSVTQLLDRLEGVRATGGGRWLANCPAHADKRPSLNIRETDNGTVLVKCFADCGVEAVVQAVGLELRDLFPERPHAITHGALSDRGVPSTCYVSVPTKH